jgi:D-arabinose 1-dehydrogenase-like Zn-dependent alcohol dehydrogenase
MEDPDESIRYEGNEIAVSPFRKSRILNPVQDRFASVCMHPVFVARMCMCGMEIPVPLPIVLGHEPVGVIDIAGPGVKSLRTGDRVGISWFQAGCGRCAYCQKKQVKFCAEAKTWITNGGADEAL